MRALLLFAAAVIAPLHAGAQGASPTAPLHQEIRWDDRGGAALRTHVEPRRPVEWCTGLRAGDAVDWEFDSGDLLDVNIHWHDGGATHYSLQKDGVLMWTGRVLAATDQTYCWMWTNRSATPIALQARMQRTPRAG